MRERFISENQIQLVEKVNLPGNMIAVDVDMDDYYVAICEKEEDVFLFTCGLGPCISAAAYCKLSDGRVILGVAHMYGILESHDFQGISMRHAGDMTQLGYRESQLDEESIKEVLPFFKPHKLSKLIETIKCHSDGEIIDIYLGGGRGYYPVVHQLYREYARNHENLRLCDTAFDPYKIISHEITARFSEEIMSTISSTFGITSTGQAILAKRINIGDLGELKNSEDFITYCKSKQISFPPDKDLVFGFETLTWKYLHRKDFEYNYDNLKKVIRKKPPTQYMPTLFGSSQYQNNEQDDLASTSLAPKL
ncbi:hypothetical protein [Legionella sp. CNM-4043-24]|uniref:hypothetical protein n=1 Tax=Legionella sp. CNM-4043-24 TaxID=3421646 RepID=UPI00403AC11D